MPAITNDEHRGNAGKVRDLMAAYEKASDLINIGAYVQGTNPVIDKAITVMPHVQEFLRQHANNPTTFADTLARLHTIAST